MREPCPYTARIRMDGGVMLTVTSLLTKPQMAGIGVAKAMVRRSTEQ